MAKNKKEGKSLPPWLKNDDNKSEKDGDSEEAVDENQNIHKFIKSIIEKNYAAANKYLQGTFEDKLSRRIRKSAKGKLF